MIYSYNKLYLNRGQQLLGSLLDVAVNIYNYDITDFFNMFLNSKYCHLFENGSPTLLVGKSSVELFFDILTDNNIQIVEKEYNFNFDKSIQYWTGYALAYYQWISNLTFKDIVEILPIDKICLLYSPYHEMDILQFVDKVNQLYKKNKESKLKKRRKELNLSQNQLSVLSDVSLRTIQEYEQKRKDIK